MKRLLFVAAFDQEDALLAAVQDLRDRGYEIDDVYTPYPVHGLPEAMGLEGSRLGWACFLFGLPACVLAFLFQSWIAAMDWPVNIGGKPFFAWQSFVPIAFEFTVLCAGLGTMATFLIQRRLFPGRRAARPMSDITNDRFVVCLPVTGPVFDRNELTALCRRHRAVEVRDVWEDQL